jgi:hypothetical protein
MNYWEVVEIYTGSSTQWSGKELEGEKMKKSQYMKESPV